MVDEKVVDFEVQNEGTIFLLRPCTQAAEEWLDVRWEMIKRMSFGTAVVVEHRYIADFVAGIKANGLKVEYWS